jgi:cysteine desulfurase/selenocysteine lyase
MLTPRSRQRDFPGLSRLTYLNTAAEGIPPPQVGRGLEAYYRDALSGMAGRDRHFKELERARDGAARLLGMPPASIGFCSCTSEAYNLLAAALPLRPRDEVVVNDLDYPSGVTPWLEGPATVRLWRSRAGSLPLAELRPLLSAKTRLVQASLVSFLNGHRLEWRPFRDLVRKHAPHAVLAVDATQALGRIPLPCHDADWVVSSTHKWILGPHGGCIVGVSGRRGEPLTPRVGGWFNIANAFEADRFERVERKPGAAGFSVGMPGFPSIYALRAALDYVEGVGVEAIAAHAAPLMEQLHAGLARLEIQPMCPADRATAGIAAFTHSRDADIHAALLRSRIHVMRHAGRLRIAVHGYNTEADIDRFLRVLARALRR